MAAVPTAFQVDANLASRADRADDIARLKQEPQLSEMDYVDISAQLELQRAYRRWPLLAEVAHLQPRLRLSVRKAEQEALS
jgi:hypothetical protein